MAQQAEKMARKLGIGYESAKGALFLAKASLGMGRSAEARRALVRAKHGFANERNNAFLGAVELVALQADPKPVEQSARIRAARNRFRKTELPLWEAICDLQILSDYPEDTRTIRRLAVNPAVTVVPHLCARFQTMRGDRLARRGCLDDAVACWRRACNVLDKVRAKLPPVDMRTAFLSGGDDPHCRLTAAELERNPTLAAAWSERRRTAGLWQVNDRLLATNEVRGRAERRLEELASQVTALSGRIEGAGKRSSAPAAIRTIARTPVGRWRGRDRDRERRAAGPDRCIEASSPTMPPRAGTRHGISTIDSARVPVVYGDRGRPRGWSPHLTGIRVVGRPSAKGHGMVTCGPVPSRRQ